MYEAQLFSFSNFRGVILWVWITELSTPCAQKYVAKHEVQCFETETGSLGEALQQSG